MQLLQSPNRWSCLITSAAMVLDETVKNLVDELGQDGSEIWWPGLAEPFNRRAFHIQEIIELCCKRDVSLTPIELKPMCMPSGCGGYARSVTLRDPETRVLKHLQSKGILVGLGRHGGAHAAAWDGVKVYDPMGTVYSIADFTIQTFWKCNPIQL